MSTFKDEQGCSDAVHKGGSPSGGEYSLPMADAPAGLGRRYLTVQQFADLSGLSLSTIRRRIRDGSITHAQPGGKRRRILIPVGALEHRQHCPSASHEARNENPNEQVNVADPGQPSPPERPIPGPSPKWQRTQTFRT